MAETEKCSKEIPFAGQRGGIVSNKLTTELFDPPRAPYPQPEGLARFDWVMASKALDGADETGLWP